MARSATRCSKPCAASRPSFSPRRFASSLRNRRRCRRNRRTAPRSPQANEPIEPLRSLRNDRSGSISNLYGWGRSWTPAWKAGSTRLRPTSGKELMRGCGLSPAGGDGQANFGAPQGVERRVIVKIGGGLLQSLLSPGLRLLRALDVNVLGVLRAVGQNRHFVRQNFGEAPGDGEIARRCPYPIADLTNRQLGNKRRVSRQNTEFPVLAGYLDLVGVLTDEEPIGSHDL